MTKRLLLLWGLLLWPAVADAQVVSQALRLQAATSLAQGSVAFTNTDDGDRTLVRSSLGPSVSLQLGAGYGLSERFVVGVTGAFEYTRDIRRPQDGVTESRWTAQLSPYAEWKLTSDGVRPYVGFAVDFATQVIDTVWDQPHIGFYGTQRLSEVDPVYLRAGFTPSAGVHIFVDTNVSLDISVLATAAYQATVKGPRESATSFGLATVFGVSGWLR